MYISKIKKTTDDVYKLHQLVEHQFEGLEKTFFIGDEYITVIHKDAISNASSHEFNPKVGVELGFSIRLNPVKRDSLTQKIVPLYSQDLPKFIEKKFKCVGFDIVSADVFHEKPVRVKKSPKQIIHINHFYMRGRLVVTDVSLFEKTLLSGIRGRCKAFGFSTLCIN